MNLQEKMLETAAELRARATLLANNARDVTLERATLARKRLEGRLVTLRGALETLGGAGRDLNVVAREHARRFVKQNTAIATAAGKDVTRLARDTYSTLAGSAKQKVAPRRAKRPVARRKARKAA